jgi:hypothetical protein
MYGFLIPDTAKRMVTSGDDEMYFSTRSARSRLDEPSVPRHILKQFPFFGNFAHRESIAMSARFIKRNDDGIDAVPFVNFRERVRDVPLSLQRDLRELFHVMHAMHAEYSPKY